MKLITSLVLVALLCFAFALAQESSPAGEKPVDIPQDSSHTPEGEKPDASNSNEIFCTAIVVEVQCPDNNGTRNARCEYVCGGLDAVGNFPEEKVEAIMDQFAEFYDDRIKGVGISTLKGKNISIQPPESEDTYCIDALVIQGYHLDLPDIFYGVRIVYFPYTTPECAPMVCPDGSIVGCDTPCANDASESLPLFTPITIVIAVTLLSACCCCLRRRKCRARCQMNAARAPQPATTTARHEDSYPGQYHHLQQQEAYESEVPMGWNMEGEPIYPPMPVIPPHMMMPNGTYPVMMQAPNGVWYPVAPYKEDS